MCWGWSQDEMMNAFQKLWQEGANEDLHTLGSMCIQRKKKGIKNRTKGALHFLTQVQKKADASICYKKIFQRTVFIYLNINNKGNVRKGNSEIKGSFHNNGSFVRDYMIMWFKSLTQVQEEHISS